MKSELDKHAQIMIVVVGFFVTVQQLLAVGSFSTVETVRAGVTFVLAVACAVRYWWVIMLLAWPPRAMRMVLLLSAWCALPLVARSVRDPVMWALALAALAATGLVTELYNEAAKEWRIGSAALSRSLRRDHFIGAASAASALVALLGVAYLRPAWLDLVVPVMVFGDCARLIEMIMRHQRFITEGHLA